MGYPDYGALVISLDFELHWGVRDHLSTTGPYAPNLLGARTVIATMLDLFEEFGIAATWAAVGFLFARNREELLRFSPTLKPAYDRQALDPYGEPVGHDEGDDPFHYAPSLIDAIHASPRQEIATHTFSHYYCLEPGQTRDAFAADLASAMAIARNSGIAIRSLVFPRNQSNPDYRQVLLDSGISCFRGSQSAWMYRSTDRAGETVRIRAGRLMDAYVDLGNRSTPWSAIPGRDGLANVPAGFFLRPYDYRFRHLEGLRMRRLERAMERAAHAHEVLHLYWHPHNFGANREENLAVLRRLLVTFASYRESHGMRSLSMTETAAAALGPG